MTDIDVKSTGTGTSINEKKVVDEKVLTSNSSTGSETDDIIKKFSFLSVIGLAFAILNSYVAMAASLNLALPSGGASVVVFGIIISGIGNLAMAASLAEITHVYPLSGGQYHFSYILSPTRYAPLISFFCGWISSAGWISLVATAGSLGSSLIIGIISLVNDSFDPQPYQTFLIYVAFVVFAAILNVWGEHLLPLTNKVALFWSLTGAVTIMVVCLATASKTGYQSATFVFGGFENDTGFPDGVAWILGLLQSSFGLTAYDGILHLCEEIPEPHLIAPKAMILAVLIGSISSFIFLIVLLFCINDVGAVINSPSALLTAFYQATSSTTGAICLLIFPLGSLLFAAQGILTGSSRMTHSLARDGGVPYSRFFARMNKDGVPHNSVYLSTVLVIIFGLIYLGSPIALNAILSSSVVFLNISYCIPISLLLIRGRHLLKPEGYPVPTLTLGRILGPVCNIIGLVFTAVTTVFFLFPPALPVTAESMNYAIAVFGIVIIVASGVWLVSGSKNFKGPRDLIKLLEKAKDENYVGERNPAWDTGKSSAVDL